MHSLIERYRDRLPVDDSTPVVSLGEGSTPLLHAPRISRRLGVELYLKCEGANPTGSFKDRGMTVAVSKAVEAGAHSVICASTGNTAASAAAYAARAGLVAVVLQPAGAVASGKLAQARALGARVLEVRGSFDEALAAARELAARGTHVHVNSLNPDRLEGQKTAAFEIVEALGGTPDVLALPYGGGGNLTAYARGFTESRRRNAEARRRRGGRAADDRRVGDPHRGAGARRRPSTLRCRASGGTVVSLSDEAILEAWRELAHAGGRLLRARVRCRARGPRRRPSSSPARVVVCVVTGHGLKDPETAARLSPAPVAVDPDPDAIEAASR